MEEEEGLQLDIYTGIEDDSPEDIAFDHEPMCLSMHPSSNMIASGIISGHVFIHKYYPHQENQLVYDGSSHPLHQASVNCIAFHADGSLLYSSGTDMKLNVLNVETGAVQFSNPRAHNRGITAMVPFDHWMLATGSTQGVVKMWDMRARQQCHQWEDNEDYIGDLEFDKKHNLLLAAGGDGYLSVFNTKRGVLEARSDNMEDELLSVCSMKHGAKVVVGTQAGVLDIFSYGDWGDMSDRFPGHPESIDGMVKIDEDTLCTGSSDGIIRMINIHPNAMVGVIGAHGEFPIESLTKSHDGMLLASSSHDQSVKFWDIAYLYDEDDDGEAMDEDSGEQGTKDQRKNGFFNGL